MGLPQLDCSGREYPACYAEEDAYEGLIVGTEFNTRHYYQASTDSLLLRGYENNLTKVEYDRPELLLPLPLTYGERRETLFHGTAAHHRETPCDMVICQNRKQIVKNRHYNINILFIYSEQ